MSALGVVLVALSMGFAFAAGVFLATARNAMLAEEAEQDRRLRAALDRVLALKKRAASAAGRRCVG